MDNEIETSEKSFLAKTPACQSAAAGRQSRKEFIVILFSDLATLREIIFIIFQKSQIAKKDRPVSRVIEGKIDIPVCH